MESNLKTPVKSSKTKTPSTPQSPQTPGTDKSVQRRVNDILVGFHKCVQTWETDNQASFNTATTLSNLYVLWYSIEEENGPELSDLAKRQYYVKLAVNRESLLKQLKIHYEKLRKLYQKMMDYVYNLKAIYFVALASNKNATSVSNLEYELPVIFTSWSSERFFRTASTILNNYSKEYIFKQKLFIRYFEFRLSKDDTSKTQSLNQCLSAWLHQPYIDINCKYLLDSMLVEAELK